jgi:hypothetical protein
MYYEEIDSHELPFAMIEFRYRSRRILQLEGQRPGPPFSSLSIPSH